MTGKMMHWGLLVALAVPDFPPEHGYGMITAHARL